MCGFRLRLTGLLCCLSFPLLTLVGQEPAAPQGGEAESTVVLENGITETAPTGPVAPADVTSELTSDSDQLRDIARDIPPTPEITQIATELLDQGQATAKLQRTLDDLDTVTVTIGQLENQRREWTSLGQQLDLSTEQVDQRWRELQNKRDRLLEIEQRWQQTLESLSDEELPEGLRQRADQILQRVGELRTEVRNRIDRMGEVTEQLSASKEATAASLRQLAEKIEEINRRLFRQDSKPLWRVGGDRWRSIFQPPAPIRGQMRADFQVFVILHWPRMLLHLFLLLVIVTLIIQVRATTESWPDDDPQLQRAVGLMSRPYSLAIALCAVPAIVLYGELPTAVRDLFLLTTLIALLRHVKTVTVRSEKRLMVSLLILTLVYQVLFTSTSNLLSRITLLVAELGLAAIAFAALRYLNSHPSRFRHWRPVVFGFAGIAVLGGSVIAAIANVLGWVSFSQFLGEGILLTCRGLVLFVLLIRIWAALWSAMLQHGPGRRLLSVRKNERVYLRFGVGALATVLGLFWVQQTLRRFRLDGTIEGSVSEVFSQPLTWAAPGIMVGDLVRAFVILAVMYVLQRMLSFLLNEEFFPRLRFESSSVAIWATLTKYAIVAGGLAMAASALGFSATQLTVLFGALSVGIGFGLQNIVSNFVSGLILMFERPIKVGDVVELCGVWGTVRRIGIRATVIQAFEGSEIVVPNGDLIAKEVKNWTLSAKTARVEILVGTSYDSDPRKVLEILTRTAGEHELVAKHPEPSATMYGFGDSSLDFRLFCHTTVEKRLDVTSDLFVKIFEALSDAGITIPFPQRDLHVTSTDKAAFEPVPLGETR